MENGTCFPAHFLRLVLLVRTRSAPLSFLKANYKVHNYSGVVAVLSAELEI